MRQPPELTTVRLRARRAIRNFRRSNPGTALVELAIVLPLLILLAIGAAEFGRIFFAAITVANAARAGAQFGAQKFQSANFAGMTLAAQNEAGDVGTIANFPSRFCGCPDGTVPPCIGVGANCGSDGAPQVFVKDSAVKTITMILKYPGLPDSVKVQRTAVFRAQ
jgi:hypothetical protein